MKKFSLLLIMAGFAAMLLLSAQAVQARPAVKKAAVAESSDTYSLGGVKFRIGMSEQEFRKMNRQKWKASDDAGFRVLSGNYHEIKFSNDRLVSLRASAHFSAAKVMDRIEKDCIAMQKIFKKVKTEENPDEHYYMALYRKGNVELSYMGGDSVNVTVEEKNE